MKKLLALAGSVLLLTGCSHKPYAQLSSHATQIAFENPHSLDFKADGVLNDIDIFQGENGSEVKIRHPGTYLVTYSPQIALVNQTKRGCFITWLAVNKKNVEDSGVKHCFSPGKEATTVLVGQWAGDLQLGDQIQVMYTGFNTQTKFYPKNGGRRRVNIPSVILTVVQL